MDRILIEDRIIYALITGEDAGQVSKRYGSDFDEVKLNRLKTMILLETGHDLFDGERMCRTLQAVTGAACCLQPDRRRLLLFMEGMGEEQEREKAMQAMDIMKTSYDVVCYAAYGAMKCPLGEMSECYQLLCKCMEKRFYEPHDRIFKEEMQVEDSNAIYSEVDTFMKEMKQLVKNRNVGELTRQYDQMCEVCSQNRRLSPAYIRFLSADLLREICNLLPGGKGIFFERELERIEAAGDFESVREIMKKNMARLEKEVQSSPQVTHREIESVKRYIYENYDKEISVDHLADMVYMAPSYLSHVFKKETGQNLSKFIKTYRMEKARELLDDTHHKIVQISYAVGYPNVSYFCQSFREYYGVSPQRYRDQGKQS